MKTLTLTLLLSCLMNINGQGYSNATAYQDTVFTDTLKQMMFCMTKASEYMYRQHRQYSTGFIMATMGAIGSGICAYQATLDPLEAEQYAIASGIFSGIALIGSLIMVDSHKWIKRQAYYFQMSGSSVGIRIAL